MCVTIIFYRRLPMKFTIHNPLDEGWYADSEARFYDGQ